MTGVRPFTPDDLPAVADLYQRVMRGGGTPPPGLASYFERTFARCPWADPELPSRVYEGSDGRIAGFVGAHVRRILIDGRPGRLVCAGQLVTDDAARRRGAGTLLLRHLLRGPQDVSITDGATPEVALMWRALGGATAPGRSVAWTRLFRPAAAIGGRLRSRPGWQRAANLSRPLWTVFDRAGSRWTQPAPTGDDELGELTAAAFVAGAPELLRSARLRLDYDEPFAEWLFAELEAVASRGRLVRRTVSEAGRVVGWYVAYLQPGECQLIDLVATDRALDAVLDRAFGDAWDAGATALSGRVEPALFEALARRRCVLRPGERVLVHSRDADLQALAGSEAAALRRIDGEWWMGHHTEPFAS